MDPTQIEDVLNVSGILSANGAEDAAHQPYLIAALIDWRNGFVPLPNDDVVATVVDKPKGKGSRNKAQGVEPEPDSFEATPDPSADEPDF